MQRRHAAGLALLLAVLAPRAVDAFCGFYVAQADTSLFNHSSKVVLVRDGDHTTLTMSNDYQGDPSEFAIVIPVPTVIEKDQIQIADASLITWIDQYTAPRMTEYSDPDPCPKPAMPDPVVAYRYDEPPLPAPPPPQSPTNPKPPDFHVKVERTFDLDEYDIVILSAKDSSGLLGWLQHEGYHIPPTAESVLGTYIAQNMHFFVAKVDLAEKERLGTTFLRPLRVSYDSPKFMLPIRLGMVNADGPQELFVFAITRNGRVETTNYRTTRIPTDLAIPPYVQGDFGAFYKAMFERQVEKQGMQTVFYEYGWPLTQSCDPCTASMPTSAQLQGFGAKWDAAVNQDYHGGTINEGYVTRLHLRYDNAHFPEDLVFQETADQAAFQGRYPITHTYDGDTSCEAGREYERALAGRTREEIANLSEMTGWMPGDIRTHVPRRQHPYSPPKPPSWWEQQ